MPMTLSKRHAPAWTLCVALAAGSLIAAEGPAQARKAHDGASAGRGGRKDAKAVAAAAQLLEQGQAALGAKDLAGARRALEQALRVSPSPEALFHLGRLAVAEGRLGPAQDLMRRFLQDTGGETDGPQQKEAQQVLTQPAGPLGEVAVLGARGALVLVDDRPVGALPLVLPLLLPMGTHRVTVELGAQRVEEQVRVLPGQLAEMRFDSVSAASPRRCRVIRAASVQPLRSTPGRLASSA